MCAELAAAFVRSPKGKYAPTHCEKGGKKTVFLSSAAAIEGQRWLRANTTVPYRPLSWGTFSVHTSANRCKNSPPPRPLQLKTFRSHAESPVGCKKENIVNVSLLFWQCSSSFSRLTVCNIWKRQMGGGEEGGGGWGGREVDDKQVQQVRNRRRS